ncbi:MAG TPA: class I SAM-dependent methyltransferase [Rhodanobacter sp.]|nr:class I SAM-dependent methyltransferase [Rhodanobacter sp.]
MSAMPSPIAIPDLAAIKHRQQAVWSTGDYAAIGTTLQIVGENLCEALDLRAGSRVLDVAAGNGNATLAASRRFCEVVSTDYVATWLAAGRARAEAEGLSARFQEADAENLPFADASFDVVLSTFGVMFTPAQERAAAELARVCRPGGRIGLANWTPEGFIGQLFKIIGRYAPPAAGLPSPLLWGTHARLDALFGRTAKAIRAAPRQFTFRYRSPEHWVEVFRACYGPMTRLYAALDTAKQDGLTRDILALIARGNRAGDGGMVLPAEYLEVVIERR